MEKKNKIEVIDYIKGYSILSIVLFHFFQGITLTPVLTKAIQFGGTGIHTFLFASGFGLYLSWLKKPMKYGEFLKRRFAKIYIPYILLVTISALISFAIPIYENSWNSYFSHVLLYKMFDDHLIGTYGYQLWFISTIVQVYLLFPLIVKMRSRMNVRSFLITGFLISFSWLLICVLLNRADERNWSSFFLSYLWEVMLGMYCAELYLKKGFEFWNIRKTALLAIACAGILLYSIMALKGGVPGKILNDVPALFGYGALCLLLYRLQIQPINRFLFFTAGLSYPLFLIHFLVLNLVHYVCVSLGYNWSWIMIFPSLFFCYLLAIPFQKFYDYFADALLRRGRPVIPPGSLPV